MSFSIDEGEFLSIIGSSGSGKTTLLRCINRLIEPTEGETSFAGVSMFGMHKRDLRLVRTRIGMIFQLPNLVERLSVIENELHGRLGYKSTISGVLGRCSRQEKQRAFDNIGILGLDEHVYKRCDQLSGGQKQRLGIARALVQNPRLTLCDKPIASLDPGTAKVIMDYLRDICRGWGITLVISLHQVDIALRYSQRVIGFNRGSILYDGSPAELAPKRIAEIYGSEPAEMAAMRAG